MAFHMSEWLSMIGIISHALPDGNQLVLVFFVHIFDGVQCSFKGFAHAAFFEFMRWGQLILSSDFFKVILSSVVFTQCVSPT